MIALIRKRTTALLALQERSYKIGTFSNNDFYFKKKFLVSRKGCLELQKVEN